MLKKYHSAASACSVVTLFSSVVQTTAQPDKRGGMRCVQRAHAVRITQGIALGTRWGSETSGDSAGT